MKTRLTGALAAFAAVLIMAPAAMAHGNFGPAGGQGQMMGQGQGYGHGGMMGYRHRGMMGPGQSCGMSGMMGPGMMGSGMMGPGMMGPGGKMGHGGMMGHGGAAPLAEDLSVDQVRHMMEHRVAMMQNPNLKIGEVTANDDDTITADVVTQDDSLVRRFMVDRHTGAMRPADMPAGKEQ